MKQSTFQGSDGAASRRLPVLALAVAALVGAGACSNGSEAASFPFEDAAPTTTSTSTSSSTPTSTTVETRVTVTTRLPGTTSTTRATTPPRPPQGDPAVTASPTGAAPETRISIAGDGFGAEHWAPAGPLWLAGGPSRCNFYAEADHEVRVSSAGRLTGYFVVPSRGVCRQSSEDDVPVLAGTYRIVYQCTACTIGEFTVTKSAAPATAECNDVGFAPNSDNMASDIVARGLSCEEAGAVVRKAGGPLGPLGGAARGEADGFTCIRTSQEDTGLPSARYECTRGGQRITFTRT